MKKVYGLVLISLFSLVVYGMQPHAVLSEDGLEHAQIQEKKDWASSIISLCPSILAQAPISEQKYVACLQKRVQQYLDNQWLLTDDEIECSGAVIDSSWLQRKLISLGYTLRVHVNDGACHNEDPNYYIAYTKKGSLKEK